MKFYTERINNKITLKGDLNKAIETLNTYEEISYSLGLEKPEDLADVLDDAKLSIINKLQDEFPIYEPENMAFNITLGKLKEEIESNKWRRNHS